MFIDRPWVIVLLNSMVVALILAIFEPFHYRLNSVIQFWVLWCFVVFIFSEIIQTFFMILNDGLLVKTYYIVPDFCYFWDSLVSFMTITS